MLDKLESELKTRGFSQKTVESYLFHNQEFLKFTNKKPEEISESDVKNYLNHLTSEKKYKPRSINLAFSSLKFLYHTLLNKKIMDNIKIPKLDKKEPVILSNDEIKSLLGSIQNSKHRLLINLMLTSGLRVSEAVSIKLEDLNLDEKLVKIKSNKSNKDRLAILSSKVVDDIRQYLISRKDTNPYLFPIRDSHITIKLPQKIVKQAAKRANLDKRVFCHALRSTFAKTLLNNNIDLPTVKELLGNNIFNPGIYQQAYIEKLKKIRNPFDDF
jgi:site-specific recombinase XerD